MTPCRTCRGVTQRVISVSFWISFVKNRLFGITCFFFKTFGCRGSSREKQTGLSSRRNIMVKPKEGPSGQKDEKDKQKEVEAAKDRTKVDKLPKDPKDGKDEEAKKKKRKEEDGQKKDDKKE